MELPKVKKKLSDVLPIAEGVAKNDEEAVKWYRKAAEQVLARAQSSLGVMYQNGKGVRKNTAPAAVWYRKAANAGFHRA